MFTGSYGRGLSFFVLGLITAVVGPFTLILVHDLGDHVVLAIIGVTIWAALWLFQSIDAYWEARENDEGV